MAKFSVPGLREKKRKNSPSVFYWEPWPEARRLGFEPRALRRPDGTPMDEGEAIAAARATLSELERVREGDARPAPLSRSDTDFSALIDRYKKDDTFKNLAQTTQRMYLHELKSIEADFGDCDVRVFTLAEGRDYLKKIKSASVRGARGRVLRLLLSFAADVAPPIIPFNPLLAMGRRKALRLPPPSIRVVTASYEAEAALVKTAYAMGRDAVALAILAATGTGQRITDILELSETQRDAKGNHVVKQSKRKNASTGAVIVYIPFYLPRLARAIAAELDRRRKGERPSIDKRWILNPNTGDTFTHMVFDHHFAKVRDAAAKDCPECAFIQFRDLRDTFVTRCVDAGCSEIDICAVTGHTPKNLPTSWRHYLQMKPQHARRCLETLMAYEAKLGVTDIGLEA